MHAAAVSSMYLAPKKWQNMFRSFQSVFHGVIKDSMENNGSDIYSLRHIGHREGLLKSFLFVNSNPHFLHEDGSFMSFLLSLLKDLSMWSRCETTSFSDILTIFDKSRIDKGSSEYSSSLIICWRNVAERYIFIPLLIWCLTRRLLDAAKKCCLSSPFLLELLLLGQKPGELTKMPSNPYPV